MNSTEQEQIQQLWYTWSDVGIDLIRMGYRIRAASEGLHDPRSEHVKSLDRYQRYFLPPEAEADIPLELAPMCLSFIIHGEDRLLVHKQYTGRDAFGRPGIFFVHLLDHLPPDFSAADAISLWQASLWQHSDASLRKKDPFATMLETIPYEGWRKGIQERRAKQAAQPVVGHALDKKEARRFEEHLSYLLWTYLIKKTCLDAANGGKEPEKIYIAAPDSYVALLISGLARCLPESWVKDMTFSTYESDVSAAPTEIVGTCWLSVPRAEQAPQVRQLLPSSYYTDKLALNCYTGERTPLKTFLLGEAYRSVISAYIPHSMQCFLYRDAEMEMFLHGMAKAAPTLEVLDKRYKTEILSSQNPSPEDVEFALSNPDLQYVARMLSKKGYQHKIIELALNKRGWWDTFARAQIMRLRTSSADLPQLGRALAQLASDAIPYATNALKEGVRQYKASPSLAAQERERFRIMKELILYAAPPAEERDIWDEFFNDLRLIRDVAVFLNSDWQCYAELLTMWAPLLPLPLSKKDYKLVQPLLSSLSWARFGDFLALDLPLDWRERATAALLSQTNVLQNQKIVLSLEQRHHGRIVVLLDQLSQELASFTQAGSQHPLPPEAHPWNTAGRLFEVLIANGYGKKTELLALLLASPMGRTPRYTESLLAAAQLGTVAEVIAFLKANGPQALPSSGTLSATLFRTFEQLAKREDDAARAGKMEVLGAWLNAPQLANWLSQAPEGEKQLARILKAARLNTEESETFFLNDGKRYITSHPSSPTLLELFSKYGRTAGEQRKEILFYWLDIPGLPPAVCEDALQAANFTKSEGIEFIEQHGSAYLPRYPQSQVLLGYVLKYLEYIQTANLGIFQMTRSPEFPSRAEGFLDFLWNWPQLDPTPKPMINDYYQVAQLIRKPRLLNAAIVESAGRLLTRRDLANENRNRLMQKLAIGCLEHKQMPLAPTMTTLSRMLSLQDIQSLLQIVAATAREGTRTHSYTSKLLTSVIRFALTSFKTILPEPAQEASLQRFLGTLLQGTDEKTLKKLDNEAKKWSEKEAAEWRRYRRLPDPVPVQTKKPWWDWEQPWLVSQPLPAINQASPPTPEAADASPQANPLIKGHPIGPARPQGQPPIVAGSQGKPAVIEQPTTVVPPVSGQLADKSRTNKHRPMRRKIAIILVIVAFLLIVASVASGVAYLLVTGKIVQRTTTLTPTPTLIPTPQGQQLFASSIQGTPVLTLNTIGTSKASVWSNTTGGPCTLTGAGYVALASLATQQLSLCLEQTQHFSDNFAYQAKVSVDANGYGGGLVLFYTSGSQSYYRFALLNSGQYSVILVDPLNGDTFLVESKPLPVRWKAGQPYLFTVIVQNQEAYFYIGITNQNSTLVYQHSVKSAINTSTNADLLGIYAAIFQNSETTITVSSLKVWKLTPGQTSPLPGNSSCHSERPGKMPPCL